LDDHSVLGNLGPVWGAEPVIRSEVICASLVFNAAFSDGEGPYSLYYCRSEVAVQIPANLGSGSQPIRNLYGHAFDDVGRAGTVVEVSLHVPEGPRPVFLAYRKNTDIDHTIAGAVVSAEPERRHRFGARFPTIVVTSPCRGLLGAVGVVDITLYIYNLRPHQKVQKEVRTISKQLPTTLWLLPGVCFQNRQPPTFILFSCC
jgi:hypothetical protein